MSWDERKYINRIQQAKSRTGDLNDVGFFLYVTGLIESEEYISPDDITNILREFPSERYLPNCEYSLRAADIALLIQDIQRHRILSVSVIDPVVPNLVLTRENVGARVTSEDLHSRVLRLEEDWNYPPSLYLMLRAPRV